MGDLDPRLVQSGLPWCTQEEWKRLFPKSQQCLQEAVGCGVAPGMVAAFYSPKLEKKGFPFFWGTAVGERRLAEYGGAQTMHLDTVFDLASLTKVIATTGLVMALEQRGWISLDWPVSSLPGVRLRHLLAHASGLPAWAPLWQTLRDLYPGQSLWSIPIAERQARARELVRAIPPECAPDIRCLYSDLSFLHLGFFLEDLLGCRLDQAVRDWVWEPMGIRGLHYRPVDRSAEHGIDESIAATENCSWRGGVLQGQVHDDNTWAMGGIAPHAGVFGTAEDLLHWGRAVLGGMFDRKLLQKYWSPYAAVPGATRALGWDTKDPVQSCLAQGFSSRTVGHLGFTGTSFWIDPESDWVVTLLTNRVHPSRENAQIKAFRPVFHSILWDELKKNKWVS